MPVRAKNLPKIVAELEKLYGFPSPPDVTGPFAMILRENVAYLANDAKRAAAWEALRRRVGTTPKAILAAPRPELTAIARAGILAADRVEKIRECARIAVEEFDGDLDRALDRAPAKAAKALQRFPSIGGPGAEKILLFSRREKVLALDSNGLRVLLRIGYGREEKNYAASYRSVREATRPQWKDDFDWLIAAHRLLRRHGQSVCKSADPRCEACPLRKHCAHGSRRAGA